MKVLITGSSGFLGRYVVAAALRHGHRVKAVSRSEITSFPQPIRDHKSFELYKADLANLNNHSEMMNGVEGVIHLAASKSSDFTEAYQGTVQTTKNLLSLLASHTNCPLVLVSSFSVYDYAEPLKGSLLDEENLLEKHPEVRDAYAQTKITQEQVVRDYARSHANAVTFIRPAMIFGQGALWNALHGLGAGPLWLLIGADKIIPLTYVENCAEAIVLALESDTARGQTINIVDDELPTRATYTDSLLTQTLNPPKVIRVNQGLLRAIAALASGINQSILLNKAKLPGLLIPARFDSRFKSFTYSNTRAKRLLNWHPRYNLEASLKRCTLDEDRLFDGLT